MNTTSILTFIASASLLYGGPSSKAVIPPIIVPPKAPNCAECLAHSGLFLGAGVDYFFDSETEYYSGKVGHSWAGKSGNYSQSLFLEVGWAEHEETFLDYNVIPVTLNYKYKRSLIGCLNFYLGGGLGLAFVDSEVIDPANKTGGAVDHDDTVFVAQVFAGLSYCVTPNFEIFGGVRYLWSDDVDAFNDGIDDWSIGLGLLYRF